MNCRKVQDELRENFDSSGRDLPSDFQTHLDGCPQCRAYAAELHTVSESLKSLGDLALTAEEVRRLEEGLAKGLLSEPAPIPVQKKERRLFPILRLAAVVAFIVLLAVHIEEPPGPPEESMLSEITLDNIDPEILARMFYESGDLEDAAIIDRSLAGYITSQVGYGQADDIFDDLTEEELLWLSEHYTMGI